MVHHRGHDRSTSRYPLGARRPTAESSGRAARAASMWQDDAGPTDPALLNRCANSTVLSATLREMRRSLLFHAEPQSASGCLVPGLRRQGRPGDRPGAVLGSTGAVGWWRTTA